MAKQQKQTYTTGVNYVNNKTFYEALIEFRRLTKEAEELGRPLPKPSNYIGECLISIATKFSYTNNNKMSFINYPFKDEMICDAIENCVKALHSFDPEKSNNPFSYFTQVCFFAFIRRIQSEKRQGYIKWKMLKETSSAFNTQEQDTDCEITEDFSKAFLEFSKNHEAYANYEEKVLAKSRLNKQKNNASASLFDFIDGYNDILKDEIIDGEELDENCINY